MIRESVNVLRHYEVDPLVSRFDVADLEDFGVVTEDVWSHLER